MISMLKKTDIQAVLFMLFLLVALALAGCSPQERLNRKLKRAEKFARKHGLTITDTIRVTDIDTFIVETHVHDTLTQIVHHDTTTVINNERVKLVYRVDTVTNEIWHHVECKGDTIVQKEFHDVVTQKIIHKPMLSRRFKWLLIAFLALASMFALLWMIKRFK